MRSVVLLISAVMIIAQPSCAQQESAHTAHATLELDGTRKYPALLTPREAIRSSGDGIYDGMVQVRLSVTIGPGGDVEEAEPIDSPDRLHQEAKAFYKQARALELHRLFQPVLDSRGSTVRAHFTDYVAVLPPERWLDHSVPFPEDVDLTTFRLVLKRRSGMVSCREYVEYTATISGSGDVAWETTTLLGAGGLTGHTTISHQAVLQLVEKVRASHMSAALNAYESQWTDGPVYTLTLDVNGMHKQVIDYFGPAVGMPSSIRDLEETVDRVANTDKLAHCT